MIKSKNPFWSSSKLLCTPFFIFGTLLLAVFQVSFLNNLLGSWSPDLIVLGTMLLFFDEENTPVFWFVFWASLFLDLVQVSHLGLRGLLLTLLLILSQWLRSVASLSWLLRLLIYAAFSSIFKLVLFVTVGIFSGEVLPLHTLSFHNIFVELVLFAVLSRFFLLVSHSFTIDSRRKLVLKHYK